MNFFLFLLCILHANTEVCWNILSPLEQAKIVEEEYIRQQQYQQQMLAEQQRQILAV
jgi:hypothetical protein